MGTGQCEECGNPLEGKRADSRWCSRACRARWKRRENRKRTSEASYSPEQIRALSQSREADERFHALIQADEARRVPQQTAREYDEHERRNPGVAHPGRTLDRITRGLQARSEDWAAGTRPFVRTGGSIADAGRRVRSQQRRPTPPARHPGPPAWDDDDPDMMEPATMIEGNAFRSGYRHAGYYR
jgi:hypothetical protein